jgi:hypothetical protein
MNQSIWRGHWYWQIIVWDSYINGQDDNYIDETLFGYAIIHVSEARPPSSYDDTNNYYHGMK